MSLYWLDFTLENSIQQNFEKGDFLKITGLPRNKGFFSYFKPIKLSKKKGLHLALLMGKESVETLNCKDKFDLSHRFRVKIMFLHLIFPALNQEN